MNHFSDSILSILLSGMRSFLIHLIALFQGDGMGLFVWIGKNWLLVAAVLIAAGLLTDFII